MAVTPSTPVLRSDARADQPLPGAALQVLCGLAWLGVAWSFSFLDRDRGGFGFFALGWAVIGIVGFGLGVLHRKRPEGARRPAFLLTVVACVLLVFPGFFMYVLVRWAALGLLLLTAARAAALHTRRDLYYALAAIVAVSLLVLTHDRAQWTIWFYLGPAWLCVALALAWDYAAGVRLSTPLKVGMSSGFLAVCIALGVTIATLLPLPATKGFGFLEPGTDHPGRVELPAGSEGGAQGRASRDSRERGPGAGQGDGPGRKGQPQPSRLGDVIERLREALADRTLPAWQRGVVRVLLAGAEALAEATGDEDMRILGRQMTPQEIAEMRARQAAVKEVLQQLLNLFWILLAATLLWWLRWRIAIAATLSFAWLLARWAPGPSMRCSMLGLRFLLRRHGHPLAPAQSLLEHVESAKFLPRQVRRWMREAVRGYGAWRFGGQRPSAAEAQRVRQRVLATAAALSGGEGR